MSEELGFSSRQQLLDQLSLGDLDRPVRPTLRLPSAALETPLPEGVEWLGQIREFLTRSGPWEDHTTESAEAFLAVPAPGVSVPKASVVGIDTPVFTSLGFGFEGVKDGSATYTTGVCEAHNIPYQCGTFVCITRGGPQAL